MNHGKVMVKVPASTANLGSGFDTLGMALSLYTWVEMAASTETKIKQYGEHLAGVPDDKSNLIYKVAQMVFTEAQVSMPELEISIFSEIPLTRGLGSSASAIIGGMAAANALIGHPLSHETLFQMATALENHPDNVGASLFGGIVVGAWDGVLAHHIRVEPDEDIEVLVAIPDYHLPTEKARQIIPQQISRVDAVYNISHASLLVAALCTGRHDLLRYAMKDRIHQPYRAAMIPGMDAILQQAADHGALGVALSGAGPTLLALVDRRSSRKALLEEFMLEILRAENISALTMWLKPCTRGVQVLTLEDEKSTFIDNVRARV